MATTINRSKQWSPVSITINFDEPEELLVFLALTKGSATVSTAVREIDLVKHRLPTFDVASTIDDLVDGETWCNLKNMLPN